MQQTTSSFLPEMLINCSSANVHDVQSACVKCRTPAAMQACSVLHCVGYADCSVNHSLTILLLLDVLPHAAPTCL